MKERSLFLNAAFNSIHKIINLMFPIITSIYVSHVLLAEGIGTVGIAQNWVQYFVIIAPLGIPNYGTREISKNKDNYSVSNKLFSELFSINFISTSICLILYFTIVFSVPDIANERMLYIVCAIPIICNYVNIEWYFQGQEEYVYISIRNVIVKIASLIAILVFVREQSDYIIYAFIYALGIGVNHILNLIRLRKFKVKLNFLNLQIKRHFRSIFILLCSAIAIELYTLLDTTMLGLMTSEEIVGYYSNSIKLNKIVVGLIAAIAGVLLPRLSYYHQNGMQEKCSNIVSTISNIMMFLVIPSATGIFCLADNIIPLFFGDSFLPAITTIRIGTGIILVLGFSNLYGTQVLLTYDREKTLLFATITGAVSNITMNAFLIPLFQQNGAIIASVVSETLVTLITFISASKYVNISIDWSSFIKSIISCAFMTVSIYTIKYFELGNMLTTLISVIIGASVYLSINIAIRNKTFIFLFKMIRKKNMS